MEMLHLKVLVEQTEVLVVCLLLSLYIQQTVSIPELGHTLRTHGDLGVLAVLHQSVANAVTAANGTRRAWGSAFARRP